MKGQYWLRKYPLDKVEGTYAVHIALGAKVRVGSEWFRWFPDVRQLIISREGGCQDENRFIEQDSWLEAKEFVMSRRRTDLVWELLAGAEWLAGLGHRRSAITEAVTALEVAVFDFARRQEDVLDATISSRVNVSSLKNWIEHMGLSGTLNYLFPLIFSEEQIPSDVLGGCQEAIQQRQNVVHNGQRDVREDTLSLCLHSIRSACRLLKTNNGIEVKWQAA